MIKSRLLIASMTAAVSVTAWGVSGGQIAAGAATTQADTVAAGARALTVAASQVQAGQSITWGRCANRQLRRANARCGNVIVPLDYDDPSDGTVSLRVSRIRHTTPRSQGVMLVNPGGPGGPGLTLNLIGQAMPRGSGRSYDWIGFDPRGVGASRPALSCRPKYFHGNRPPYVPVDQAGVDQWLERAQLYARSCAKYGELLDNMTTVDNVRDIDEIRKALGVERINWYGYSYGTYLGQVYATLFPQRVRRMVLDSNVDPREVWYEANLDQNRAFQPVYEEFFGWLARHRPTYHVGRTAEAVQRTYLRERRVLRRNPAGLLGPSEYDDAMLLAGYSQDTWPFVGQAFSAWVNHRNPRPLLQLWRSWDTPGDDNLYAVYLAVICTDAPWPDWPQMEADARQIHETSPIFTWGNTWFNAPCLYWPGESSMPVDVDGNGVRALLVGQTREAATPFEGSLEVRARFPESRLIAIRNGTTHGTTPFSGGPCVGRPLAAYLKTGALPPRLPGRRADVACPAPPRPAPQN